MKINIKKGLKSSVIIILFISSQIHSLMLDNFAKINNKNFSNGQNPSDIKDDFIKTNINHIQNSKNQEDNQHNSNKEINKSENSENLILNRINNENNKNGNPTLSDKSKIFENYEVIKDYINPSRNQGIFFNSNGLSETRNMNFPSFPIERIDSKVIGNHHIDMIPTTTPMRSKYNIQIIKICN